MAFMSRLDVMQHALDEQRKDELRKESEALHQIKWHRINLRRPRPAAKVFVPVADSDADFEMLRARVATLRLVQRRLQAEATVLTCELASVDGVGATARRTQLTNRSSLWHLADDLDRSLVAEQRATLDGALGEVEEEGEEAEAGDGRLTPRGQSLDDGGWERAAALMTRLDAMASALEEQRQLARQAEARVEAAEATGGVRAAERKLRARVAEVVQHGQSARLGSAPARLLHLLRARLAAPGSSALPGRDRSTGRPATASGARASRLQS